MTITVAQVSNTNTFEYLINRVNDVANAMSTYTVTTDSNTAAGNAAISGQFWSNTVLVGNSTVNIEIVQPNTAQAASTKHYLNANGSWAEVSAFDTGTVYTAGTTSQTIDEFDASTYKAAEYLLHITDTVANGYQLSKVLVVHTGNSSVSGQAFATEYGIVTSNTVLGVFSSSISGANVVLSVTPSTTGSTVSFSRVNME